MPWHWQAMKDVISCDKSRGVALELRSGNFRMEKSNRVNPLLFKSESIAFEGDTQGSETSQYLKEKKSTESPQVVASERGSGQTDQFTGRGCGTPLRYHRG